MQPGFKREELSSRYDVEQLDEDDWHAYSGEQTSKILEQNLSKISQLSPWLLNAGAGVYALQINSWVEVSLDLFVRPIHKRSNPVCAGVERLPFKSGSFGAIVCVGEVLAYCDPSIAIREFSRVLRPFGILVCDFGNSRSVRRLCSRSYGRAADLITDYYNGTPERTWVYDPRYIVSLLKSTGFAIRLKTGIHTWSALSRRMGVPPSLAVKVQRRLEWIPFPKLWADLTTIVAVRASVET